MRSTMLTSSLIFSSSRSMGSSSMLRVAVFAIGPRLGFLRFGVGPGPTNVSSFDKLRTTLSNVEGSALGRTHRSAPMITMTPLLLSLYRPVLPHERCQNRIDALLHLGVGERAIACLKRQTDGNADAAR